MSERRLRALFIVILLGIAGLSVWSWYSSTPTAKLAGQQLQLDIAKTPVDRQRGLSGRTHLADTQAMLFVFDTPGRHCFWMQDMQFSIDILWLDQEGEVLYVRDHISPETYPESFCPDKDASYVLETKAGKAKQLGVGVGSKIELQNL